MIIAITPNPALDITYTTPELAIGEVNRVEVRRRAGGKGINVARVLHQLGHPATVMGVLAGLHGQAIAQDVLEPGLAARWSWQAGESRATVNVVTSDGNSTMLNEPGEQLDPPKRSASSWMRCARTGGPGWRPFRDPCHRA
jgi:fructose-1-phosphate kinase PfkB-like protein